MSIFDDVDGALLLLQRKSAALIKQAACERVGQGGGSDLIKRGRGEH